MFGADPGLVLDEEDEVRELALDAALEVAERADRNRRVNLANMIGQVLSGE